MFGRWMGLEVAVEVWGLGGVFPFGGLWRVFSQRVQVCRKRCNFLFVRCSLFCVSYCLRFDKQPF